MQKNIEIFQQTIWDYYRTCGRVFAWRQTQDPYLIFISEIMLQQTQTHRVAYKYEQFAKALPSFKELAEAPLRDVLLLWQGLGYNRRAIALHNNAKRVVHDFNGILPPDPEILRTFYSIGPNTAGSICAFAFNKPTVFIETNIRAVFIHFFFTTVEKVSDKDLIPLVEQSVDNQNPREWYYALMDYGVMLKKTQKNPARKSKHHTKQSIFEGSHRQIRGMILKLLSQQVRISHEGLLSLINREPARIEQALSELCCEGFLLNQNGMFSLTA